jgi:uncharacterized protein HemX
MSTFTEQGAESATTEAQHVDVTEQQPSRGGHRRNGLLLTLVIVLAAAVVGLGVWVIVDQTSTSDTAVTDDVQQLLDDYYDAWNDHDGDAYLELMTDNARHVTGLGETSAAQQAAYIDNLDTYNWHVEPIGDAVMSGDGRPWYVAQVNLLTSNTYPDEGYEGMSVLTIIDDGGTLRISRHVYNGQG